MEQNKKTNAVWSAILRLRDHLMVGVSYMLPVIVGGAICFGLSLAIGNTDMFDDSMSHGWIAHILFTAGQAEIGRAHV